MKNFEIERKYLVKKENIPKGYKKYKKVEITQAFIYLKPAIRIRKADKKYYLTVKNKVPKNIKAKNDLIRMEYEFEISKKCYNDLLKVCKGNIITKTRYYIPYKKYVIELDIFKGAYNGLIYAEVEFNNVKEAERFIPPDWFYKDVTGIEKYKNTSLSICKNISSLVKY